VLTGLFWWAKINNIKTEKVTQPVKTHRLAVLVSKQVESVLSERTAPIRGSGTHLLVVLGLASVRLGQGGTRAVGKLSTDESRLGGRLVLRVQEALHVLQRFAAFLLLLFLQRLRRRGAAGSWNRGSSGPDSE